MDNLRRRPGSPDSDITVSGELKIFCFRVRIWAWILTIVDAGAMSAFVAYGWHVLSTRNHVNFDTGPPWMAILVIAAISVFFSVVMCIGMCIHRAGCLVGQMVMQAARLAIVLILFIMYIAWSAKRRIVDNLGIPASKRPVEFWTILTFTVFGIICFQIFYFHVATKTYAFLRSGRMAMARKAKLRELEGGSFRFPSQERPRISIVEEIFLRPAFQIRKARRKSLLKMPEHLGLNSDRIAAFPVTASHYKLAAPAEFERWATKRSEIGNTRGGKRMSV